MYSSKVYHECGELLLDIVVPIAAAPNDDIEIPPINCMLR